MRLLGGRRAKARATAVAPELYDYFTAGIMPSVEWARSDAPGAREFRWARFFRGPDGLPALWRDYRERVLEEWRARQKGKGEPWAVCHLEGRQEP